MKKVWFYLLIGLAVAALGVAAYSLGVLLRPAPELRGTELITPAGVGDLTLEDAEGRNVTLGDYRDDLLLVFFGFTRCPDVCPLTMSRLAETYRELGEPEDLRVVMITVDPGHDTPQLTHQYATGFHPAFVGLGGSNPQIAAAAERFFVGYNDAGNQGVIHTDMVLLVDRQSQFRMIYSPDKLGHLGQDLNRIMASNRF